MIEETLRQIPKQLAYFSNEELYFIISELLGLGGLSGKLIEEESLYIKPSSNYPGEHFTFLFSSRSRLLSKYPQSFINHLSVGRVDASFNDIHLHTISFRETTNDQEIDIRTIKELLKGNVKMIPYQPVTLIKGLLKIIKQPGFMERSCNMLFKLSDQVDNNYCQYFDLGNFNDSDYSGMYYCIAQPNKMFPRTSTIIHQYAFEEIENASGLATQTVIMKDHLITTERFNAFR